MSEVPVRLLRETLREGAATAPSDACLDADTLAAWCDDALSAADRRIAESHAASCARCQAMLAAMAIAAPPAPTRQWWRPRTYTWLAPLAAAAAAAVVWVAVPRPIVAPQAPVPTGSAVAEVAPARSEQRVADAATAPLKPDTTDAKAAPPVERGHAKIAVPSALRDVAASTPPPLPSSPPIRVDAFASSAVPPAPPSAAAPPQPPAPQAPRQAASSAVAPPARFEAATGVAPNANESVRLRGEAAGAPAQALAKTSAATPDIVSPDRNARWRLRNPGSIERSLDGGLTWQTQPTGVATPLVSGAAPSPTICWVIGTGGIVLRSIDGATWQRVGLAEAIDLTAIRAADALNATVTTADARTFTTDDGGKTWRPR